MIEIHRHETSKHMGTHTYLSQRHLTNELVSSSRRRLMTPSYADAHPIDFFAGIHFSLL